MLNEAYSRYKTKLTSVKVMLKVNGNKRYINLISVHVPSPGILAPSKPSHAANRFGDSLAGNFTRKAVYFATMIASGL